MTKPRVIHVRDENKYDDVVYIGRPSRWGNMWSHQAGTLAKYKVATREEAIAKFEEWIRSQPELMAAAKRELRNKNLACFCYPALCHGMILLKIANEE
jgi:hypothetical protein